MVATEKSSWSYHESHRFESRQRNCWTYFWLDKRDRLVLVHLVIGSANSLLQRIGRIDGVITKLRNGLVHLTAVRRTLWPEQQRSIQQWWVVHNLFKVTPETNEDLFSTHMQNNLRLIPYNYFCSRLYDQACNGAIGVIVYLPNWYGQVIESHKTICL